MPVDLRHSRLATARWMVLAPHPDDETLGAGALIATAAAQGRLAGVAFLTDGTGSHPDRSTELAKVRRREASLALRRLGAGRIPVSWIGWRDAQPCPPGTRDYHRDISAFAALLRRLQVDAIAVTAINETHCDHVAAYHFAKASIRRARRAVSLVAYHVWSTPPARGACLRTSDMPIGQRRDALRAHRSQLTASMGAGFRLPRPMQRMSSSDRLYPVGQ